MHLEDSNSIRGLESFNNSSIHNQKEFWFWSIITLYLLTFSIYFSRREIWRKVNHFFISSRIDLLIVFAAGIISMFILGGVGINFIQTHTNSLPWLHMFVLFLLPIVFFVAIYFRKFQNMMMKKNDADSSFMSDKEGTSKDDDAFEFFETASRFAERVYNNGSTESLVFGIDAPWGTGKSTFINLCKEQWNKNHNDEIIVYTFDPLRFENSNNILDKFVEGLLKVIKDNFFAPELESLISKYVKLLNDAKVTFSIFGIRFGVPFDNSSIDKIFERLQEVLRGIDKKIVIVVDDLDRLNFSNIKEILFVIKKSFILPNISYVLCYDTENITALEYQKLDSEKIIEFLEKFVNIKTSLYLDNQLLLRYFTENKDESLARNLFSNPELVSKAVEGLKDIFKSQDYYKYVPFIGDARKLKRLVNTIILLEVEQQDFSNSDFDKHDLIHLLIIYINYPNIFRKIYNTESQGKRGFFSLVGKYDIDYPKMDNSYNEKDYMNSIKYNNYVKELTENQKFIVDKIFNENQRLNSRNISDEQFSSYACFNGSSWNSDGRNLEQYLNLIIKVSRPPQTDQYKFYLNTKNDILIENENIGHVLNRKAFSFSLGEANHNKLWKVLVNSSHNEFSREKSKEIILYALDSLPKYSVVEIEDISIGLRNFPLPYYISKLLDKIGWFDESGKHWNNSDENVIEIAEWIFGENKYENIGIINILARKERGILGIYDLLKFRLHCCTDRGGDLYNLSKSLSKHGSPDNPVEGIVSKIVIGEMREISQVIYRIFESRYIINKTNIFEEVLGLEPEVICGDSYSYARGKLTDETLNNRIKRFKSSMLSFIIYQLGSAIYGSGIPCGYYDAEGDKDERNISHLINEYLFEICFNPELNERGYDYFLYYLFLNFETTLGYEINRPKPFIEGLTKVLKKDQLRNYWEKHNCEIRARQQNGEDDLFKSECGNYYMESLKDVYEVLDNLLKDEDSSTKIIETKSEVDNY